MCCFSECINDARLNTETYIHRVDAEFRIQLPEVCITGVVTYTQRCVGVGVIHGGTRLQWGLERWWEAAGLRHPAAHGRHCVRANPPPPGPIVTHLSAFYRPVYFIELFRGPVFRF